MGNEKKDGFNVRLANCVNDVNNDVRNGTPGKIRTCDPLIRSQILYPAELRVHPVKSLS